MAPAFMRMERCWSKYNFIDGEKLVSLKLDSYLLTPFLFDFF
jgi:hypothetical protein